ncbi:MAG: 30S ribosome-binding factor RbfA [Oscillospiraceae bacterium]|jgi:ribosome-binding factor A|nr:30S ribosome-binding factor RbfA [Oscillospiraceae bacterium]
MHPTTSHARERINEDIQRELSVIIGEVKDPRVSGCMVSVIAAETSKDQRYCKVHVSAFGTFEERELLKGLKSAAGFLRGELCRRLKLRQSPELTFTLDRGIEHAAKIDALLKNG